MLLLLEPVYKKIRRIGLVDNVVKVRRARLFSKQAYDALRSPCALVNEARSKLLTRMLSRSNVELVTPSELS